MFGTANNEPLVKALNNIAAAIRELAAAQRQEYSEEIGEPQQVETYLDGTPVK